MILNLIVSGWTQLVTDQGRGLTAHCRFDADDLVLSDGTPLKKLEVLLSFFETSRMQKYLEKLSAGAIGTLHYSPYQDSQDDIPALETYIHG